MFKLIDTAISFFDMVNDLRLHVALNYFLVVSWFLYSSDVSVERSVGYAFVSMCMLSAAYLLNRFTDYEYDLVVDRGLAKANKTTYMGLSVTALIIGVLGAHHYETSLFPVFLGIFFGISYSMKTAFSFPIKNYFLIKNLFASFSKYIVTLVGVLLFIPLTSNLIFRSISMFAFYLIYEILWDVRDIQSDIYGKVKTLPNTIGKNLSLFVCTLIWSASLSGQYFFVNHTDHFYIKYIVVLSFILSLLFVSNVRWYQLMTYAHMVLNLIFINEEILLYIKFLIIDIFNF